METKSILITGGAGFIGSNIVEYLLDNNVKHIRILDNLSTGKKSNIDFLLKKYANLEFIHGDICNLETCRKAVKQIDIICHQAALVSVPESINDPLLSHQINTNGFLNILISAKEEGIKRIVYASSAAVYGDDETFPKIETNIGNLLSPYAATKFIDEIYASVFVRCYGMECIGLRYFNIFGPRQDPHSIYSGVISKFVELMGNNIEPQIYGDGTFSRDFTYVDNVVYANVQAMFSTNSEIFGQVFNIGCGEQCTLNELVKIINQTLNKNIKPIYNKERPGDIPYSCADISKAISILDYKVLVNFNEGIKKLLNN